MINLERKMKEERLEVKYMGNVGTSMMMSEKWRDKHEGRMMTVGVVRTEKTEKGEEIERDGLTIVNPLRGTEAGKREEIKPLEKESNFSLGAGWEW
jgi:hypothetical protein